MGEWKVAQENAKKIAVTIEVAIREFSTYRDRNVEKINDLTSFIKSLGETVPLASSKDLQESMHGIRRSMAKLNGFLERMPKHPQAVD